MATIEISCIECNNQEWDERKKLLMRKLGRPFWSYFFYFYYFYPMGQCECTNKADGFKSEVIVEKESLTLGDVPSSVHLLNNFPPISKRII